MSFHSDRATFGNDLDSWDVRTDNATSETFAAIKAANETPQTSEAKTAETEVSATQKP